MTVAEYPGANVAQSAASFDPRIVVSLQMGNSEHVVEVLKRRGEMSASSQGSRAPSGLGSRDCNPDDLVVVVAPTHEWAGRRRPITASEQL